MLEIRQNPENQLEHQVYGTKYGKVYFIGTAEGCLNYIKNARKEIKKKRYNAARRERNQILRDLCGTSARAAREDMGL